MKVSLLKSNSSGVIGTYKNVNHHAKGANPLVDYLYSLLKNSDLKFDEWVQGTNVHQLINKDGRTFTLRPFKDDTNSWGIQISIRQNRKVELPLYVFKNVEKQRVSVKNFLRSLSKPIGYNHYGHGHSPLGLKD